MSRHYIVWVPENGEKRADGQRINALDHEDAAKVWAQWKDAHGAEYRIVGGQAVTVSVAEAFAGAEVKRFVVTGRAEPVYSARSA